MGDLTSLAKARRELEELYLGVPDDSVNLTFQDLAQLNNAKPSSSSTEKKKPVRQMDPITEGTPKRTPSHHTLSPLTKIPSLDFSRGLEASANFNQFNHRSDEEALHPSRGRPHNDGHASPYNPSRRNNDHAHTVQQQYGHGRQNDGHMATNNSPRKNVRYGGDHSSMGFDDMSGMSGISMASMSNPFQERNGRRRPGIPHSNICTICSVYIYVFRHRCLVCGRVYCRECLAIGMGEMTEGRKCIQCLGKKFSQRYIQRAGKIGCWTNCFSRYPSTVKFQEIKWAEKGPRRHGEMGPTNRPRTPTRAHSNTSPPSFIVASPYSPYSSTNHHLPL